MPANEIRILTFDGVDCYEQNGTAYLKLETVARGLGFTTIAKSGNEVVRWNVVYGNLAAMNVITDSCDTVADDSNGNRGTSYRERCPEFIAENVFYRLAMRARNERAEKFQAKVADEIIPSIRRTGTYVSRQAHLSELSPETQLLMQMVNAMAKKELADNARDRQIRELSEKVEQQGQTLQNVKEEFTAPYDNWRVDVNAKVRQIAQKSGIPYQTLFGEMYAELDRRGFSLARRQENKKARMEKAGNKKTDIDRQTTKLAVIEDDKHAKQLFADIVARYAVRYVV